MILSPETVAAMDDTMHAAPRASITTRAPMRYWRVKQARSSARVLASTIHAAADRARQIGFRDPDSIVLEDPS